MTKQYSIIMYRTIDWLNKDRGQNKETGKEKDKKKVGWLITNKAHNCKCLLMRRQRQIIEACNTQVHVF